MHEIIIDIVNKFGYIGIFLLIAVENIFPPIPSEVILTFGGFMTTKSEMNIWIVILVATLGSVAGAVALYTVGRVFNTARLERLFAGRLGRMLHLKKEDVGRAERRFKKHGRKAVFFGRFLPIVRSLISIPAGVAKMPMKIFLPLTAAGTLIWNFALVFLGRLAGSAWERIADYFDIYSLIAAGIFAVAVVVVGVIFIKKRFLNGGSE